MLVAYSLSQNGPRTIAAGDGENVPEDAGWIDLVQPTRAEDFAAERFLKASLPTREEAQEIEFSSRFYGEDGAVFMTVSVLTGVDIGKPALVPLTIVVAGDNRIATLRYDELRALQQFMARAAKPGSGCATAPGVFLGLIEAIVDRTADVLERISADVDRINQEVFAVIGAAPARATPGHADRRYRRPGRRRRQGAREPRLAGAPAPVRERHACPEPFRQGCQQEPAEADRARRALARGPRSPSCPTRSLFLLDATLGLISVDQNEVIRILTVAATIFFPPTLIGTDLRHELPRHAGASLGSRLSDRDRPDDRLGGAALSLFQAARLALTPARLSR